MCFGALIVEVLTQSTVLCCTPRALATVQPVQVSTTSTPLGFTTGEEPFVQCTHCLTPVQAFFSPLKTFVAYTVINLKLVPRQILINRLM